MKKRIILNLFSLFLILSVFGITFLVAQAGSVQIPEDVDLPSSSDGIKGILSNLLNWLLGLIGIIAILGFVISGVQYIVAAGNDKDIEKAKKNMTYSIIGAIVALSGYIVVQAIDAALNAESSI